MSSFDKVLLGIDMGDSEVLVVMMTVTLKRGEIEIPKFLYEDIGTSPADIEQALAKFKGHKERTTKTFYIEEVGRSLIKGAGLLGKYLLSNGVWSEVQFYKVTPILYLSDPQIEEYIETMGYDPIETDFTEVLMPGDIIWYRSQGNVAKVVTLLKSSNSVNVYRVTQILNLHLFEHTRTDTTLMYPDLFEEEDEIKVFRQTSDAVNSDEN